MAEGGSGEISLARRRTIRRLQEQYQASSLDVLSSPSYCSSALLARGSHVMNVFNARSKLAFFSTLALSFTYAIRDHDTAVFSLISSAPFKDSFQALPNRECSFVPARRISAPALSKTSHKHTRSFISRSLVFPGAGNHCSLPAFTVEDRGLLEYKSQAVPLILCFLLSTPISTLQAYYKQNSSTCQSFPLCCFIKRTSLCISTPLTILTAGLPDSKPQYQTQ